MNNSEMRNNLAAIEADLEQGLVTCRGHWTATGIKTLEKQIAELPWDKHRELAFDCGRITLMDTTGAWLLHRTVEAFRQAGGTVRLKALKEEYQALLQLIDTQHLLAGPPSPPPRTGFLENLGRRVIQSFQEIAGFLSFVGQITLSLVGLAIHPGRIRWRPIFSNIQAAGFNALPIIGLLSFLIGVVIAYQGGIQLRQYGASLYIADLVGLSMIRELAPLMTAILVAGRTGAAYTAQLATMKVTEEIDAVTVMGISPLELLVIPKIIGLIIVLPLLTIYADILGILGGMAMASVALDINPITFLNQLSEVLSPPSYLIGIGKAPIFAAIIAAVGCYQGFMVRGSAESVGRQTTISVVQAIFLVIVTDAAFSILFSWFGV